MTLEVLAGDFKGKTELVDIVLDADPDVFAHNLETVPRLSRQVRVQASYPRSYKILEHARKRGAVTKTGLMLGLGETLDEVDEVLRELAGLGVDIVTLGQYLSPSKQHLADRALRATRRVRRARAVRARARHHARRRRPAVRSSYHADGQAALVRSATRRQVTFTTRRARRAAPARRHLDARRPRDRHVGDRARAARAPLPDGFAPDVVTIDGAPRELVSAVPFRDLDFRFRFAPFVRFAFGQTIYRAYVKRGDQRCVWFFGTSLGTRWVAIPRYWWKLPWHRARIEIDARYLGERCERYALRSTSKRGDAELELSGGDEPTGCLPGFASADECGLVLTHPFAGCSPPRWPRRHVLGVAQPVGAPPRERRARSLRGARRART